jgi:hypothetical protein
VPSAKRTTEWRTPRARIEPVRLRAAPAAAWIRMIFESLGSTSSTVLLYTLGAARVAVATPEGSDAGCGAGDENRYGGRFGG